MDVQRLSIWEQPEPTCSMKGKSGDPKKAAQIDVKEGKRHDVRWIFLFVSCRSEEFLQLGITRFEVAKLWFWMKNKKHPCKSHLMSIENHRTSSKVYGFTFNFDLFLSGFSLKSTKRDREISVLVKLHRFISWDFQFGSCRGQDSSHSRSDPFGSIQTSQLIVPAIAGMASNHGDIRGLRPLDVEADKGGHCQSWWFPVGYDSSNEFW